MIRLFMLLLILSLTPSGIYAAGTTIAGEQNLLLFYSNDVMGETEPCG
jgi:hypothetical protein